GYEVAATVGGGGGGKAITVTATPDQRSAVVSPLPDGSPLQLTVRAGNGQGMGPKAASNPVTPTQWWPFKTPAALVARQYLDILERPPSTVERAAWVTALSNRSATVSAMAMALYNSAEAQNSTLAVAQLWVVGTHAAIDRATLSTWVARLRAGTTFSTFGRAIAQQPAFASRYANLGNRVFVVALSTDLLGAPLPATATAQWAAMLDSEKVQRGDLLAYFGLLPQARSRWGAWAETDLVLLDQLGATPSLDVLFADVTEVAGGRLSLATLVDDLTRSASYGARVGLRGTVPSSR
ncbi:MAG: hypothetical protein M3137_16705, partial [Actinomycetota bacterium]|nr:hypothetical protein [Actinomycetota bacterium]